MLCGGRVYACANLRSRRLNRKITTDKFSMRRLLPPCRVTNSGEEILLAQGLPIDDDQGMVEVDMLEVHYPELGRLERRVGKFYLDELENETGVDSEETAYWFHVPPGGWTSKPVKLPAAEEAPITFPQPWHDGAEMQGRIAYEKLEEGMVITGVITDCWLYHGIQIDFGAACDGLVPIYEEHWMEEGVRETLLPGVEVQARIYKLRRPGLFRWPVQLELLEPSNVVDQLLPADEYEAPIDHGWAMEQGMTIQELVEATGRVARHKHEYIAPIDDDIATRIQRLCAQTDQASIHYVDPEQKK